MILHPNRINKPATNHRTQGFQTNAVGMILGILLMILMVPGWGEGMAASAPIPTRTISPPPDSRDQLALAEKKPAKGPTKKPKGPTKPKGSTKPKGPTKPKSATVKKQHEPRQPPPAHPKPGDTWQDSVTGIEFGWIPGGSFEMGAGENDPDRQADEYPVHHVTLSGFWLGKYEVTQSQWQGIMGRNKAYFHHGGSYPMERVSWSMAREFLQHLNQEKGGLQFRLPTEAEWEYVCRSGGKPQRFAGGNDPDPLGWHSDNADLITHPVGQKQPNGLGIYDMSGNVWELVSDGYDGRFYRQPEASGRNPVNKLPNARRVIRGGAFDTIHLHLRCTARSYQAIDYRFAITGFRLVMTSE